LENKEKLLKLRREIDNIDNQIIDLLKKRMEISRNIGLIKWCHRLPINDKSRERYIYNKYGDFKEICESILIESRRVQERVFISEALKSIPKKNISIIGYGYMGKLFARLFSMRHNVCVYDINREKLRGILEKYYVAENIKDAVLFGDIIFISVTISDTKGVLKRISELLKNSRKRRLVTDIATIKHDIIDVYKLFPGNVNTCSIHPLFGGNIRDYFNKKIIIIPIKGGLKGIGPLIQILKPYGFKIILSNYKTHDEMIAKTIIAPYILGLLYCKLILNNMNSVEDYGGSSYQYFKNYIQNILLTDSPEFIYYLLTNRYGRSTINEILNIVNSLKESDFNDIKNLRDKLLHYIKIK